MGGTELEKLSEYKLGSLIHDLSLAIKLEQEDQRLEPIMTRLSKKNLIRQFEAHREEVCRRCTKNFFVGEEKDKKNSQRIFDAIVGELQEFSNKGLQPPSYRREWFIPMYVLHPDKFQYITVGKPTASFEDQKKIKIDDEICFGFKLALGSQKTSNENKLGAPSSEKLNQTFLKLGFKPQDISIKPEEGESPQIQDGDTFKGAIEKYKKDVDKPKPPCCYNNFTPDIALKLLVKAVCSQEVQAVVKLFLTDPISNDAKTALMIGIKFYIWQWPKKKAEFIAALLQYSFKAPGSITLEDFKKTGLYPQDREDSFIKSIELFVNQVGPEEKIKHIANLIRVGVFSADLIPIPLKFSDSADKEPDVTSDKSSSEEGSVPPCPQQASQPVITRDELLSGIAQFIKDERNKSSELRVISGNSVVVSRNLKQHLLDLSYGKQEIKNAVGSLLTKTSPDLIEIFEGLARLGFDKEDFLGVSGLFSSCRRTSDQTSEVKIMVAAIESGKDKITLEKRFLKELGESAQQQIIQLAIKQLVEKVTLKSEPLSAHSLFDNLAELVTPNAVLTPNNIWTQLIIRGFSRADLNKTNIPEHNDSTKLAESFLSGLAVAIFYGANVTSRKLVDLGFTKGWIVQALNRLYQVEIIEKFKGTDDVATKNEAKKEYFRRLLGKGFTKDDLIADSPYDPDGKQKFTQEIIPAAIAWIAEQGEDKLSECLSRLIQTNKLHYDDIQSCLPGSDKEKKWISIKGAINSIKIDIIKKYNNVNVEEKLLTFYDELKARDFPLDMLKQTIFDRKGDLYIPEEDVDAYIEEIRSRQEARKTLVERFGSEQSSNKISNGDSDSIRAAREWIKQQDIGLGRNLEEKLNKNKKKWKMLGKWLLLGVGTILLSGVCFIVGGGLGTYSMLGIIASVIIGVSFSTILYHALAKPKKTALDVAKQACEKPTEFKINEFIFGKKAKQEESIMRSRSIAFSDLFFKKQATSTSRDVLNTTWHSRQQLFTFDYVMQLLSAITDKPSEQNYEVRRLWNDFLKNPNNWMIGSEAMKLLYDQPKENANKEELKEHKQRSILFMQELYNMVQEAADRHNSLYNFARAIVLTTLGKLMQVAVDASHSDTQQDYRPSFVMMLQSKEGKKLIELILDEKNEGSLSDVLDEIDVISRTNYANNAVPANLDEAAGIAVASATTAQAEERLIPPRPCFYAIKPLLLGFAGKNHSSASIKVIKAYHGRLANEKIGSVGDEIKTWSDNEMCSGYIAISKEKDKKGFNRRRCFEKAWEKINSDKERIKHALNPNSEDFRPSN